MAKVFLPLLALAAISICSCNVLNPFAPLPAEKQRSTTSASIQKLEGNKETFTGRVVLAAAGYRLKLSDSEDYVRLSRAKRASEVGAEEVNLRKYYEKTLAVHGVRQKEWIWAAEIVGQWLRPGDARGSNLSAPPVGQQ